MGLKQELTFKFDSPLSPLALRRVHDLLKGCAGHARPGQVLVLAAFETARRMELMEGVGLVRRLVKGTWGE